MMWLAGAILVFIRTGFMPENFSPEMFSKRLTVAILTTNSAAISTFAMPVVEAAVGQSLLTLPLGIKTRLAVIGAVSAASWLMAMAMGVSKVLAAGSWLVFVVAIPVVYAVTMGLAAVVMARVHLGMRVARHQPLAQEPHLAERQPVRVSHAA